MFCGVILASYWLFLSAMACDWPAEWKEAPCYIKTQSIAYFYCKEDMIILRIHPCPAVYIGDWPRSHNTLLLREIVDDYIQVSHNIQKKMARYNLTLVNSAYVSRKHLYVLFGNW